MVSEAVKHLTGVQYPFVFKQTNKHQGGWGDGSVLRALLSFRGYWFDSHYLHGGSQASQFQELSTSCVTVCTQCTDIPAENTHTHKISIFKKRKGGELDQMVKAPPSKAGEPGSEGKGSSH